MLWLPKFEDSMYLINLEGRFGDIKTPFEFLDEIRTKLLESYHRFTLRRVIWDETVIKEIKQIIKHYKQSHTDIFTYGKIALGYTFMKFYRPGYTKLTVRMNPELRKIIHRFARWKDKSFGGDLRLQHLKILIDELHGYSKLQFSRSVRKLGHPAEDLEHHLFKLKTSNEILILKRLERGREVERIYSVYLVNDKIMRYLHIDEEKARQNKLRTDKIYQHGMEKILWTDKKTFWELYGMRFDDRRLLEDQSRIEDRGYKCWVNKRYYLVRLIRPSGYIWRRYYDYMRKVCKLPLRTLTEIRKQSQLAEKRRKQQKGGIL
jgi:ribosomal protein S6